MEQLEVRWPDYHEPKTAVAEVIQRPLYLITPEAIVTAYFRDSQKARQAKRKLSASD
ncbi:hypothetical protein EVB91_246 [Rhizobium phage RHph_I1_18]|nr:hypothetical protein EVB91_246 [Rhizobium phage RHph_I1_18]